MTTKKAKQILKDNPKLKKFMKPVFTDAEFDLLFEAMNCLAMETQAIYEAGVETRSHTIATQKAIRKLEDKLAKL